MTPDRRVQVIVTRPDGSLYRESAALAYQAGVVARARAANELAHPRRPALVRYGEAT